MTTQKKSSIEQEIVKAEKELMKSKEKLAKLRRQAAKEEIEDHAFKGVGGKEVRLSELFADKQDLILIRNMGKQCSYCTTWADGFNGVLHHLQDRAAFTVVSPDNPETQKEFAASRNWDFKMVSSHGVDFGKHTGFDPKDNPGVNIFHRNHEGKIFHVAQSGFGPGDNYCIVFDLFDLLPKGVNGWHPKFKY